MMKPKEPYTHNINVKLTESQYQELHAIKEKTKKSISALLRYNIGFLVEYYKLR